MGDLGSNLSCRSSWDGSLTEPCFIDQLDAALLTEVLGRLEAPHIARAACVCGAWANAAASDQLWKRQFHALCSVDYLRNCQPQLSSMLSGDRTSSRLCPPSPAHLRTAIQQTTPLPALRK